MRRAALTWMSSWRSRCGHRRAVEEATKEARMGRVQFHWDDPLLLEQQLTMDEIMVRDAARVYAQQRLAPRVQEAFRQERTDPGIFREMGELGLLGTTLPADYGGPGTKHGSKRPYQSSYSGSFMIQQNVGFSTVVEAAWVFNLMRHLLLSYPTNAVTTLFNQYQPSYLNPLDAYLAQYIGPGANNASGMAYNDNYFRPI